MTTPQYHFITGLPRSGSTLLAALLLQNPRFHADIMSPVGSLFTSMIHQFTAGTDFSPVVTQPQRRRLVRGLFDSFYAEQQEKSVIFDNNRMWSAKMPMLIDQFPNAKVIACVRDVAWVMDSMERRFQANPYELTRLFNDDVERNTVYSRVDTLGQRNRLVGYSWSALKEAFYGEHAASLLVIDYDLLVQAPARVLALLYGFLDQPPFEHDFEHIVFDRPDFDIPLGMHGMHKVRPAVGAWPRATILPPDLFEQYSNMAFWKNNVGSRANVVTGQPGRKT